MRDDFAVFILSHGRPDRVATLNTLLNILTAIIFDLEINSKSLFGGPGEGQKYF